jgi:glycosidase
MRRWLEYHKWSKTKNPAYDTRKPTPAEREVQKLLAIFQMTYVGAPMIYYGDEAGMWGANDPCCRKPMIWEDVDYADEVYLPNGKRREQPDKVGFDRDLFEHYRKLIHLRNAHPALQTGDYQTLLADDERDFLAFSRSCQNENIIVVINNSRHDQDAKFSVSGEARFVDLMDKHYAVAAPPRRGQIDIEVKAKSGRILLRAQRG